MINNVTLVGRLTKDPILRRTANNSVVAFTIACNRYNGQTDFIQCEAWGKVAENINLYVKKGQLVGACGSIRTDTYEKDGVQRYKTYVVCNNVQFLEPKSTTQAEARQTQNAPQEAERSPYSNETAQPYTREYRNNNASIFEQDENIYKKDYDNVPW